MKTLTKEILRLIGIPSDNIRFRIQRRAFGSLPSSFDVGLVETYLAGKPPYKLQIGSGYNSLDGWLNSEWFPLSDELLHLDATETFPIPDDSFDFVYSEHMIEHIPYPMGCNMLRECHRVLKPGGTLRISTPDLQFVLALYGEKSELQNAYIEWSRKKFIPWAPESTDTFVINNFVRDWGHCFIYDEKTLRSAMLDAGFATVKRCAIQESDSPELQNLENESRSPPGFLRLETLTLEATKAP